MRWSRVRLKGPFKRQTGRDVDMVVVDVHDLLQAGHGACSKWKHISGSRARRDPERIPKLVIHSRGAAEIQEWKSTGPRINTDPILAVLVMYMKR